VPVACSTSALTGQEGSIFFKPAGTQFCLRDYSDFPAGTSITVPTNNDYKVGDAVKFTEEGTANLDSALTAGTTYYVVAVTSSTIQVSATSGGSAITLAGDGGTGSADTAGDANHIQVALADFQVVCQVREVSLEITREELDTTVLPCDTATLGSKFAAFRATQPGFASGTGSMTVYFTDDQTSLALRLQRNVLLKTQEGAAVKLYLNTVANTHGGGVNDTASLYVDADVRLNSMSLQLNPDDPTTAEITYTITNPRHILGETISGG
jgi:hypothetical protein